MAGNRAAVCTAFVGESGIAIKEWPDPELPVDGFRIAVHSASVNYPDCLAIRGQYQVKSDPPFIPGSECAGLITEVGGGVTRFAPGERVVALPAVGAFATDIVVTPPVPLHRIPDSMPFDDAAAFTMTYGTAYHGLMRRGQLKPGETVLVIGASGGTGSAAVQVAKAAGATVIATAGGPEKCALAAEIGADVVIDHREVASLSKSVRDATNGRGVDVLFDPVAGEDIREQLRCLDWAGRYLVVGFASGQIPRIGTNQALLKGISIVGVAFGADAFQRPEQHNSDFEQLLGWYSEGLLKPHISARYEFDRTADALRLVYDRKVLGKVVIGHT